MDAKLPPPDPNEGPSGGPSGFELAEPLMYFPLGRPSDAAERVAGAILTYRPGALFVFDTR